MRLDDLLTRIPRHAGWLLAATLLLTAVSIGTIVDVSTGQMRLEVDASADRLLPEDDASRTYYDRVRRLFGADETLIVALSGADVFTPEGLARIERLSKQLGRLDGVHQVLSVANAVDVRPLDDDLEIAPFLTEMPTDVAGFAALRDRVLANPIYGGSLVSPDARTAALVVYLREMSNREYLASGLGARIAELARAEAGDGDVYITGGPRVREETARILLGEAFTLSLGIALAMAVVLAISFRSAIGVVLPIATIAVALTWTLALIVGTGHSLNVVTALVPPLLTALGLSYSVHVVSEYQEVARESETRDRRSLVATALGRVALPVGLTGLTTAVGFASLALSPLGAVREFGLFAVAGVLATVVATLSFTPSMLVFLPTPPTGVKTHGAAARAFDHALERIARFDYDHRHWIFLGVAVVFGLSLLGASQLRVGSQQIGQFREDAPVRRDFEVVNRELLGANPFYVVIESESPNAFKEPANLQTLEGLQGWLLGQPEIGGAVSVVDYLGLVHRGLVPDAESRIPESRGLVSQLLFFGAGDELDRFVDARFGIANIQVRANVFDSDEMLALTARIEQRLAKLPSHLQGNVTGTSVVLNDALDTIIRGQTRSVLLALGIIYVILSIMFVSLRIGALALIPNMLPVAVYFGALGAIGIRLDTATSLIAPMVIGIAVDDTIHYFARFIRDAKRLGNERDATVWALLAVGRPVTYTSAALCIGFLVLNASELRSQGELGSMAAFALGFAWLSDLTVTPALCSRLKIATLWDLLRIDLGHDPHRSIPLFAGLRAAQARIVATLASVLPVREGERLFNAGEPGEALYVVIEGRLRSTLPREDGTFEFGVHERGDVVGEVGFFHAERTTDMDAMQDTRLLRLTEDEIAQLAARYPRIGAVVFRNLNAILARRLTRTTRWLQREARPDGSEVTSPDLEARSQVLDDAFFRRHADRYREELRLREMEGRAREAALDAAGLPDPTVVERLTDLGIRADTLAALTLIPLVEVAWVDGSLDGEEREAVLAGAEQAGMPRDSTSFRLLEHWLSERPDPGLLEAWGDYIEAVCRELSVESRLRLRSHILGRARVVAEAAGGFLGLAATSRQEERLLNELERAFEASRGIDVSHSG